VPRLLLTRNLQPRARRSYGASTLPRHYFPGDDPSRAAPSLERHTAHIYTNWVKAVYESTPYSIEAVPNPSKIAEAVWARSAAFVGS
jgi:homoserine trans-succinylase